MLSITDNFLYVIDSGGHQVIFDTDKLKNALQEAFAASGNPNSYLAEDIACAVEAAMMESARPDRIFAQSEVDGAVSRILENAGCAGVAQLYCRANSSLYISVDVNCEDTSALISRHLGLDGSISDRLAAKVVGALKKLNIASASPALYLELARYYEHTSVEQNEAEPLSGKAAAGSRMLLPAREIAALMPPEGKYLLEHRILQIANIRCLYPNCRLSLDLTALADFLKLHSPVTELEMAPALYKAGEIAGTWLDRVIKQLENPQLPLYLVLKDLDIFATRYLGTEYPAGRLAALEIASFFRNALGYPVKKVRCRTAN